MFSLIDRLFFRVIFLIAISSLILLNLPYNFASATTTWSVSNLKKTLISSIAIDAKNSQVIYAGTSDATVTGTAEGQGLWKTTNGGLGWFKVSGTNLLDKYWNLDIAIDPKNSNIVYVTTNGYGVFKTTNGGANWAQKTNGIPKTNALTDLSLPSIVIDPNNTSILYVGTADYAAWKTIVGYIIWLVIVIWVPIPLIGDYIKNYLKPDPKGVIKSTNAGENWYQTPLNNKDAESLVIDPQNTNKIYVGTAQVDLDSYINSTPEVYLTEDGGNTWSKKGASAPPEQRIHTGGLTSRIRLSLDPTNSNNLYGVHDATTVYNASDSQGIYKSTNSGDSWMLKNAGLANKEVRPIAVDPLNPSVLYAPTNAGVYISVNSGDKWVLDNSGLPNNPSAQRIAIFPTDTRIIFGTIKFSTDTNNGVYKGNSSAGTLLDSEPPTGSVSINNGANYTNEYSNSLNLLAHDNVGVTKMMISENSAFSEASWENYANQRNWNFSAWDGTRIIYAKYRDDRGNPSQVYSYSIILDTTSPTGSVTVNNGASSTFSTLVNLTLSTVDRGSGVDSMKISTDSSFTNVDWEAYQTSKYARISSGKGPKAIYVKYSDRAGNESIVYVGYIYLQSRGIIRIGGIDRYETAVKIVQKGWEKSDTVILTRGDLFPDALAGVPLAAKYNAPILLTYPTNLPKVTSDEIKKLAPKQVIILGSEDAVAKTVENEIKAACGVSTFVRIGGVDRFETSRLIADRFGAPPLHKAILATGENYPDALTIGSYGALKGIPIVLVKSSQTSLEIAGEAILKKLGINNIIIVGGKGVITEDLENWFKSHQYNCSRLAGNDRYATAASVANYGISDGAYLPDSVFITTGENFPDALSGGPLAYKERAAMLLTNTSILRDMTKAWVNSNKANILSLYLLGSTVAISKDVEEELAYLLIQQ